MWVNPEIPDIPGNTRKYPKYPEIPESKKDTWKYPIVYFDTHTRPDTQYFDQYLTRPNIEKPHPLGTAEGVRGGACGSVGGI